MLHAVKYVSDWLFKINRVIAGMLGDKFKEATDNVELVESLEFQIRSSKSIAGNVELCLSVRKARAAKTHACQH